MGVVRFLSSCFMDGPPSPAQCRMINACDTEANATAQDVIVTCAEEGHGPNDPHTLKKAFDIRTKDRSAIQVASMLSSLRLDLGSKFTVIYECPQMPTDSILRTIATVNPKATAPHIHMQVKIGYEYP